MHLNYVQIRIEKLSVSLCYFHASKRTLKETFYNTSNRSKCNIVEPDFDRSKFLSVIFYNILEPDFD